MRRWQEGSVAHWSVSSVSITAEQLMTGLPIVTVDEHDLMPTEALELIRALTEALEITLT